MQKQIGPRAANTTGLGVIPTPLQAPKIAAQYDLGGSTYEGTMPDGTTPAYVKEIIIPPEERIGSANYKKETRRIEEQAAIGRQLIHPNHITLLDYVVEGNIHRLYYPIAAGRKLQDIVAERSLDTSEVLCILEQVAAAYAYAHQKNPPIVHADTSPGNVVYDPETKHTTVIDHGASLASILDNTALTTRAHITNGYAAPEVLSGEISPKVDIYGLGMLLSFMLTGKDQRTFIGWNGILKREELESVLQLHTSNPALVDLWKKMTAENPAERPTAAAVLESLDQIREGKYLIQRSQIENHVLQENADVVADVNYSQGNVLGRVYYSTIGWGISGAVVGGVIGLFLGSPLLGFSSGVALMLGEIGYKLWKLRKEHLPESANKRSPPEIVKEDHTNEGGLYEEKNYLYYTTKKPLEIFNKTYKLSLEESITSKSQKFRKLDK